MNKLALCLFAFVVFALAHPTKYQVDRNVTCLKPTPAPIKSWHIHILYWQNNQKSVEGAYQLRDKFMKDFAHVLGAPCTDLFHQDHLCMFEAYDRPDGPFLVAQWAAFVPLEHFQAVTQWSIQNRSGYDLLIHPNSGCEVEDHTWWAMWSGTPWQLDTSIFSRDQPEDYESLKVHQKQAEEESLLIKLFNRYHNNNNN
ncbi:hypothetical protein ABPG74_006029 [Tetrahymena malaccensis]